VGDVPKSTVAALEEIADELYALPPDEFVPARDDRVAAAKEAGDRDLARALGRLRRPTRAAWLVNLLARHRADQLDGLVALASSLAKAQHDLDGDALRALSGQRHRAVAAMARDAGRLAARQGEPVNDALLREVQGILDAALADPAVAEEVRSGRLTKSVRYSGFGVPADGDGADLSAWAASAPAPAAPPAETAEPAAEVSAEETDRTDRERAERARAKWERERADRERAVAEAESAEAEARERQEADEADRDGADERHVAARSRVAELAEALQAAREEEQAALEAARAAAAAARASARDAAQAAVRTTRARTRLEQLPTRP
jgi:hypothetical protein